MAYVMPDGTGADGDGMCETIGCVRPWGHDPPCVDAMAEPIQAQVRLVSGASIEIHTRSAKTVAAACRQVCDTLQLPIGCVKLITSAGFELADEDRIDVIYKCAPTAVVLRDKLQAMLEERLVQACDGIDDLGALRNRRKLIATCKQLTALSETFGQLVALQKL